MPLSYIGIYAVYRYICAIQAYKSGIYTDLLLMRYICRSYMPICRSYTAYKSGICTDLLLLMLNQGAIITALFRHYSGAIEALLMRY